MSRPLMTREEFDQLKVGDTVTVAAELDLPRTHGAIDDPFDIYFDDDMFVLCGRPFVIDAVGLNSVSLPDPDEDDVSWSCYFGWLYTNKPQEVTAKDLEDYYV